MNPARWTAIALFAFAVVVGGGILVQRQAAAALRSELNWLRDENRQLARTQEENRRLKAGQIPAEQLERLRSDRAALVRLRNEIETMKSRLEQTRRAEAGAEGLAK